MGIFDFFKKNKNIENDNGYNEIYLETAKHIFYKKKGKVEGEYKGYYKSGELLFTVNWVDGLKQGEYKGYYKSGELKSTVNWVDGLKQGEMKRYYESGELESTENYVDNVLQRAPIKFDLCPTAISYTLGILPTKKSVKKTVKKNWNKQ